MNIFSDQYMNALLNFFASFAITRIVVAAYEVVRSDIKYRKELALLF